MVVGPGEGARVLHVNSVGSELPDDDDDDDMHEVQGLYRGEAAACRDAPVVFEGHLLRLTTWSSLALL